AEFLINAAEGFFFISGMTLGIISFGKPLEKSITRLLTRAWVVYLYVLMMTFGFGVLILLFGINVWSAFFEVEGGWLNTAVNILTMKQAIAGADILVAYVVYLALAPLALWGLHYKRPVTV
ncbi:MAG: OpgC domain-containing protein, partial [Chloroflexota bacterium]